MVGLGGARGAAVNKEARFASASMPRRGSPGGACVVLCNIAWIESGAQRQRSGWRVLEARRAGCHGAVGGFRVGWIEAGK
jgi:hypothetical protein